LDDDYEIGQCLKAYAVETRTQDFIQKISPYAPCFRKGQVRRGVYLDVIQTACISFTRHGTSFRDTYTGTARPYQT
jgi:hypothetical protein